MVTPSSHTFSAGLHGVSTARNNGFQATCRKGDFDNGGCPGYRESLCRGECALQSLKRESTIARWPIVT